MHQDLHLLKIIFCSFVDGEFRPDIDESDDEETIAIEEEEGIDEVRRQTCFTLGLSCF